MTISSSSAPADAGLACLLLIARFHGVAVDARQLAHELALPGAAGPDDLVRAGRHVGLKSRRTRLPLHRLDTAPLPLLAVDAAGGFFVLARLDADKALIHDPEQSANRTLTRAELAERYTGEAIQFTSRASLLGEAASFDFSWFLPALVKYRRLIGEVLLASLALQLFALLTPVLFQVVMDKVLVHRSLSTLDVLVGGMLLIGLFESALSLARSYVFSHTTSRIDVELGARLYRHLLRLPLAYFQARRVGDSVARVRELENIRSFLTGNGLSLLLDVLFTGAFLAVMWIYSGTLTLVVLASLPLYMLLSAALGPLLRRQLQQRFQRGAENQSFLVESMANIETIKASATDPQFVRRWDQQLADYVHSSFRANATGMFAQEGVGLVGKLVNLATLWLGARLVISGELTVGQLVAFNMLAGRVAAPVMRLAQMWTSVQQVGISVARLGDVLNTRVEGGGGQALPTIRGDIRFEQVGFRYRPEGSEILRALDLDIPKGQVIGIVGRSGSGKSTLTKLLQRLYQPVHGRVLVDGIDIAGVDSQWLRRQIGVVLQENRLFTRSVRDNIALADPATPFEAVVEAARLAGAHDFIVELPQGYDTVVDEGGCNLSGGQRQRIAIARALATDPRILIFDEATSALDYESECRIQHNMRAICRGRTVLIVAHRLAALRFADRIVVVERGTIVEDGSHDALLARKDGIYAMLHGLQAGLRVAV